MGANVKDNTLKLNHDGWVEFAFWMTLTHEHFMNSYVEVWESSDKKHGSVNVRNLSKDEAATMNKMVLDKYGILPETIEPDYRHDERVLLYYQVELI